MKYLFIILLLGILTLPLSSGCNNDEDDVDLVGNWVQKSDFEGHTRTSAVSFVISDIAYVGTGFNGSEEEYYNDFWKYDPALNFWQKVAEMPGAARSSAVAFAINGLGYIGTGYDGENSLNDFWRYDPGNDSWERVADFPGTARYSAVGFSIGDMGYVGTGYDGNDLKDFFQFDPVANTWTQIPSIGGSKRKNATVFVQDDKAYVLTGVHNGQYQEDMWQFNPTLLSQGAFPWIEKNSLTEDEDYNIIREDASTIVLNNEAYIMLGKQYSYLNSVWHYIDSNDSWEEKTGFEGNSRTDAVAFAISGRAFIALGGNGSLYFDDIWEFKPGDKYDEDD